MGINEIGFHWGRCAYRHGGALADAQEGITELYNSLGLCEPYECLFVIDVIERSLRDIYSVIPMKYKIDYSIPDYVMYQSQANNNNNEDNYDKIDIDLINALKNVRNTDLLF